MPRTYAGRKAMLLTQHGKESVVGPVLREKIGCYVERVEGFDTDLLGTFTRDVARQGTQVEAARRKARIGLELSGGPLGLGSEGSFGPDPLTGLVPWNTEVLVWLDDELGIEIVGFAEGPAAVVHRTLSSDTELMAFAEAAGFPGQHLVLRPNGSDGPGVRKGLADTKSLLAAFHWAQRQSVDGTVFAEFDLRAHACPSRRERIRAAAEDLSAKLASSCPACATPGFWLAMMVSAKPCANCGAPTTLPSGQLWRCTRCNHQSERPAPGPDHGPPERCTACNP